MKKLNTDFSSGKVDDRLWAGTLAVSLLMTFFMPTGESLWVDEGYMAQIISHPRLADMISALTSHFGSEPQMPLAAFFYWSWGKFFGHSELALRIANLLPLGFGVVTLALACRPLRMVWPCLLVSASPITWFFVNEVRPYALQLGGAMGMAAVLLVVLFSGQLELRWAIIFGLSSLIVAASSMLGIFCLCGMAVSGGIQMLRGRLLVGRGAWLALAITTFLLAVLGIYYFQTLMAGSGSYRGRSLSVASVGFALYELFGFGGLGPGRLAVRDISFGGASSITSLFAPYLGFLAPLAIVWLLVGAVSTATIVLLFRNHCRRAGACLLLLVTPFIGGVLLIFGAAIMGFPFWGRHILWTLPFLMTAICCVMESQETGVLFRVRRVLLWFLFVLFVVSSLQQRFSSWHRKEDYRNAAAVARKAAEAGQSVWWAAASAAGEYYGLNFHSGPVHLHDPDHTGQNPAPDVIVISRPEITDSNKFVRKMMADKGFHCVQEYTGFRIYEKTGIKP